MSSIAISLIVFVCVFGAGLLAMYVGSALPPNHLSGDSKNTVAQGIGLVGTLAALVLGLLVASAKGNYDAQNNAFIQMCANVVFLDRILAFYGPEAIEPRHVLHDGVVAVRDRIESTNQRRRSQLGAPIAGAELLYRKIQQLSPRDDTQRALQAQALSLANNVGQTRWLVYEQNATSVPKPLLAVLVLWLIVLFMSFGLFAPRNATVVFTLFVSALSVSEAIFLILEMYQPLQGLIQIPTAPIHAAIAHLLK